MIDREIIYVLCGLRDLKLLEQSINIVRSYDPDFPITIYYNEESGYDNVKHLSGNFKSYKRKYHKIRENYRNSDRMRFEALIDSPANIAVYLDNDIFIVNWDAFLDGFELAKKWGLLLPLNPRIFLKTEIEIGTDVSDWDKQELKEVPKYAPVVNAGIIFFHKMAKNKPARFLSTALLKHKYHPSRGPMDLFYAMWKEDFTPLLLPYQWLVCQKHVGIDNPICLHVGHKPVMEWWEREFKNVRA